MCTSLVSAGARPDQRLSPLCTCKDYARCVQEPRGFFFGAKRLVFKARCGESVNPGLPSSMEEALLSLHLLLSR